LIWFGGFGFLDGVLGWNFWDEMDIWVRKGVNHVDRSQSVLDLSVSQIISTLLPCESWSDESLRSLNNDLSGSRSMPGSVSPEAINRYLTVAEPVNVSTF
jgi:hypothetical protein